MLRPLVASHAASIASLSLAALCAFTSSAFAAEKPAAPGAGAKKPGATRNVAIVLYEGVELLDFAGPTEVFKSAAGFGGGSEPAFRVYTVAATHAPLKSLGVVTITPEFSIEDSPKPDIIVLPAAARAPSRTTRRPWRGRRRQ
jgi:hypothetical protein